MKLKTVIYSSEQEEIRQLLIQLLKLENNTVLILHEMDNNIELQNKIMDLSLDIKKYFNCNNIKAITEPSRIKRPWLSIIKTILKPLYTITAKDYHFAENKKYIHTQKYTFKRKLKTIDDSIVTCKHVQKSSTEVTEDVFDGFAENT